MAAKISHTMKQNTTLSTNFSSIFAQLDNIEDVKLVANALVQEITTLHNSRVKELKEEKNTLKAEVSLTSESKSTAKTKAAAKPKSEPKEKKATTKKKKSEPQEEPASDTVSVLTPKEIAELNLTFEPYKNGWVLYGDTKPIRQILKTTYQGKFSNNFGGKAGWIFRKADAEKLVADFGLDVKIA